VSAERFREQLFEAGVLADGGVLGIYHRSLGFERIVAAVSAYVSAAGRDVAQRRLFLGPLQALTTLERCDYLASFPNLAGVVSSFTGSEAEVPALVKSVEAGPEWTARLSATDVALCPAGCHPLYPLVAANPSREDVERFEIEAWCFRREPSVDPARMQSFRMREFVYVGTSEGAVEHRDRWLDRGRSLLSELGLDVAPVVANDPFFGRAGRLLASYQRTKEVKYELVAPISSPTPGAIGSANCHEDHFGSAFGIRLADGGPAHSACIGFGLERIALALLLAHGLDSAGWPRAVRRLLEHEGTSLGDAPA
jgi:seryl-tRNA synthetase